MADEELNGGMDGVEQEAPPSQEQQAETEQRARDEAGRFAPRGQPDSEAARRREATERDEWKRKYEERDKSAAEIQANYERLNKRFEDMASIAAGKVPGEEEKPDPLMDLSGKVDQIAQRFETQDKQAQEAEAWTQVRSYADQDEARFSAATPDFPNAVQHYITSRIGELNALGLSQDQAEATLQQEAQQLLVQCAQSRKSPAETIYALSKSRGYSPGVGLVSKALGTERLSSQPTGGRSLGTGQGSGAMNITADQITRMTEPEYEEFKRTPQGRRAIGRMMGNPDYVG